MPSRAPHGGVAFRPSVTGSGCAVRARAHAVGGRLAMSESDSQTAEVCEAIESQVEHVLASTTYQSWLSAQRLQAGDFVILNNSFLFRQGVASTTKNPAYLAFRIADDGERAHPVPVVRP